MAGLCLARIYASRKACVHVGRHTHIRFPLSTVPAKTSIWGTELGRRDIDKGHDCIVYLYNKLGRKEVNFGIRLSVLEAGFCRLKSKAVSQRLFQKSQV